MQEDLTGTALGSYDNGTNTLLDINSYLKWRGVPCTITFNSELTSISDMKSTSKSNMLRSVGDKRGVALYICRSKDDSNVCPNNIRQLRSVRNAYLEGFDMITIPSYMCSDSDKYNMGGYKSLVNAYPAHASLYDTTLNGNSGGVSRDSAKVILQKYYGTRGDGSCRPCVACRGSAREDASSLAGRVSNVMTEGFAAGAAAAAASSSSSSVSTTATTTVTQHSDRPE